MRNCHLDSIKDNYFTDLTNLTGLFLSENNILTIEASSFSSLINLRHLDLSHNHNSNKADTLAYIDSGLDINSEALTYMKNLEHLDFSFTKIKSQSFEAFNKLNTNLRNLSLCSTNMPLFLSTMLKKTSALSILDISENSRAVGNNDLDFGLAKDSLEVLFMENCALQSLDFVKNLSKIKVLGLYYNNINVVDNKSVSHLADLDILDLGRNFISNWYEKIFSEEQSLTILNLRNNKISNLTNDMQSDLKHVRIVGLGDNDFECMCSTRHVFNGFFDNTAQFDEFTTFLTETSLDTGASSRIYSKLKHLVIIGREILQKLNIMPYTTLGRNRKDHDVDGSDSFLSQGTILFDYNELSYKCMDDKKKVNIQTICPETYDNNTPAYMKDNNNFVRNIVITVIAVAVFFILSVLIYWKWWYIKYSFILLRNSTILSFLKDEKDPLTESKENTGTEFSYDVFVSYCDENRAWVLDEMLPNIEKREEINICLHERDFQVTYLYNNFIFNN